jgi:mannose-6-phosphate isomerase
MQGLVRLTPSFREKLWGRTKLSPWFPDSDQPIGEVWYLSEDEDLPLLVKLLFTTDRLSIQVHPADGEDGPRGKSEMWHILEAEPGASIAIGFREPITEQRLRESIETGEIEELVQWHPVKAGETYYTPAHTVHAIGTGIVLCEIQQNSDVTYRLWDYRRPRPIHVEQGVPISDLTVHPGAVKPTPEGGLVRCPHFVTEEVRMAAGESRRPGAERSQLWICLEGRGVIGDQEFQPAEVWRLPEGGEQPVIRAETAARFLRTFVPK